jgi:apolipoprotein N-acyltransferase
MLKSISYIVLWITLFSVSFFDIPICCFLHFFCFVPLFFYLKQDKSISYFILFSGSWFFSALIFYGFAGKDIFITIYLITFLAVVLTLYLKTISILIPKYKNKPFLLSFIGAALWTSIEYGLLFLNIPFVFAVSQHRFLFFIQSANLLGIHFISFLIIFVNFLLFSGVQKIFLEKERKKASYISLLIVAIFFINTGYGYFCIDIKKDIHRKDVKVSIIQPVIYPEVYLNLFKPENYRQIKEKFFQLLRKAGKEKPDIIAWPEIGMDTYLFRNAKERKQILSFAKQNNAFMILGAPDRTYKGDITNSIFYISSKGELLGKYDKIIRVPFIEEGYAAHEKKSLFEFSDINISGVVCFESVFSGPFRKNTNLKTDLFFVLSNDVYFKNSLLARLHYYFSIFRAIETGSPLVRITNNGVSCIIDNNGKILHALPVDKPLVSTFSIPVNIQKTLFSNSGNIFPILCCLFIFYVIAKNYLLKKNKKNDDYEKKHRFSIQTDILKRNLCIFMCMFFCFLCLLFVSIKISHKIIEKPAIISDYLLSFLKSPKKEIEVEMKKASYFRQKTLYSCGPASLAYLLKHYGIIEYTEDDLIRLTNAKPKEGTSIYSMCEALKKLDLVAVAKRVNYPALKKQKFPIVAFLQKHFIVITEVKKHYIITYEPTDGVHYKIRKHDFLKMWNGFIISVSVKEIETINGDKI